MRACFIYFPRILTATLNISIQVGLERVQKICESFPEGSDARSACFAGIGANGAYIVRSDFASARAVCTLIPNIEDQAACYVGQITIDIDDRQSLAIPYCSQLSDTFKAICYQSVFYKLHYMGGSVEDASTQYCHDDALCLQEAKDYKLDPWQEIRKKFGTDSAK
jgi:hypothetical protein